MTFSDFSKQLSKIEATPKRLQMTSLLADLLKQADSNEVSKAVMLSLGRLAPLYRDIDFGMAEKTVIRSLVAAYNLETKIVVESFKKVGDLGEAAGGFSRRHSARLPRPDPGVGTRNDGKRKAGESKISVSGVYDLLFEIAVESGDGSQERKIEKTADLLRELDPLGAKYAVRIILGNLRLGFSDKTVLDALSVMIAGDKSARERIEAAYNVRPDVGWLAKAVKRRELWVVGCGSGVRNGDKVNSPATSRPYSQLITHNSQLSPKLGIPIMPALCQRLPAAEEIITKMKKVAVEPKWDGQRIQAHLSLNQKSKIAEVNLFTRSLEDVTEMFPDLVQALGQLTTHNSQLTTMILDGEAVAIDPATGRVLPFQTMITRKRKYGIQEKLADVPIKYMVFDILYLNEKSLMNEEFTARRKILERSLLAKPGDSSSDAIIQLAPQLVTSSPAEIRKFLKQQIDAGLEGIVAKRLDAPYIPGRTQFAWVKLKWEGAAKSGGLLDTVDCVVMGTYAGRGKRSSFGVGAFLVGIYSPSSPSNPSGPSFLTISKIGTGLTDEQWRELKTKSKEQRAKSKPKEYVVPKELTPDSWLRPELVVEIQADNITKSPLHTAGFALRFPRLVRYRIDKLPEQITTLEEVKKLYGMQ